MGKTIQLKASDGHEFDAYVAEPAGKPRGLIVVAPEIFGANQHIRGVADGKAGIVGYCWGGVIAWVAASRLPGITCSVPYYGGAVPSLIDEKPKCPVMFQWGEVDASIPLEKAKAVEAAHPECIHHFYPGGHGFNCDERGSYHGESAKLARERTLEFFAKHLG